MNMKSGSMMSPSLHWCNSVKCSSGSFAFSFHFYSAKHKLIYVKCKVMWGTKLVSWLFNITCGGQGSNNSGDLTRRHRSCPDVHFFFFYIFYIKKCVLVYFHMNKVELFHIARNHMAVTKAEKCTFKRHVWHDIFVEIWISSRIPNVFYLEK